MASFRLPARRCLLTGGFALVIGLAPAAWLVGAHTVGQATRSVADPAICQGNSPTRSTQLACSPSDPGGNGTVGPTEGQLTQHNDGQNAGGGPNIGAHH
jgi:hypothetical protein